MNYRKERIERLFEELKYEISRGMIENEIEEEIVFSFIVPISRSIPKGGVVYCEFRSAPVQYAGTEPRLKLVGK